MSPSPCSFTTALDESFAFMVSLPIIFCSTSTYLPFSRVGNLFLTVPKYVASSELTVKDLEALLKMAPVLTRLNERQAYQLLSIWQQQVLRTPHLTAVHL